MTSGAASERELRRRIIETARELARRGLTSGTSGNVSARWDDGFLITPSGLAYEAMTESDVACLDADGACTRCVLSPSSEWRIHRDVYRAKPEAGAVVHAHPHYSTALSCTRREIPAFHYMVAVAGGRSIPCAAYATFGTEELSRNALAVLRDCRACLLANHGSVALGRDLGAALDLLVEVEALAGQYCEALRLGGVVVLSDAEMDEVLERFRTYGARSGGEAPSEGTPGRGTMWYGSYVPRNKPG